MKNFIKIILINIILFTFTACDSSNYTLLNNDLIDDVNGIVVDGYINDATVCIDIDKDGSCDNEYTTTTSINGEFNLNNSNFDKDSLVVIMASGGTDTSTGRTFEGEIRRVVDSNLLEDDSEVVVSPITDLVAVSFLDSKNKDTNALNDAKTIVSDICKISKLDLYKDPMKDITIFMKSQILQYTKSLIFTAAKKNINYYISKESELLLQNEIKIEILNWDADVQKVLIAIGVNYSEIPTNEITFVKNQIDELETELNTLSQDTSLSIENLYRLQKYIDTKMQEANDKLKQENTDLEIEIIDIDLSLDALTQTDFEITDAILDEQACVTTNGYNERTDDIYNHLSVSNTNEDEDNGISIISEYPEFSDTLNLQNTDVSIYYPNLQEEKINSKSTVFDQYNNYYFHFDEAWLDNENNTIYIKTPKNDDNLSSCYRYNLNSSNSSEIIGTKVFSYSPIQ